jgi:hypothetical protein
MTKMYRVVDCRTTVIDHGEMIVRADYVEHAALLVLGEGFVRGTSRGKGRLVARVYYQDAGQPLTMVRLYEDVPGKNT